MLAVPLLPAASLAVKVMVFAPSCRPMLAAVQAVVPCAVPLPPLLLDQVTSVTASLSLAVPLPEDARSRLIELAENGGGSRSQRITKTVHALATLPEFQLG